MAILRRVGLQSKRQELQRLVDCLDGIDRSAIPYVGARRSPGVSRADPAVAQGRCQAGLPL